MPLRSAWHLPLPSPANLVRVAELGVALAADGTVLAFDQDGEVHWSARTGGARALAVSDGVVVTLGGGVGGRFTLTGRGLHDGTIQWATSVPARRMTRLFAGDGIIHGTLARSGRFVLESYQATDGATLGALPLDRRRAMVALDGRRVWTRDADGLTEHDRAHGTSRQVSLADGPMTEAGPWLVTSVGDTVLAVRDGAVLWRTRLSERDLTEVGLADGLDDDGEADLWDAEPGRPTIAGDHVYVADLSGRLHCLALTDGTLRWTALSRHYPSAAAPARVATAKGVVVWPGSDEVLYLVAENDGAILDSAELPFPFEGAVETWGPVALLPCADGVRAYRVD